MYPQPTGGSGQYGDPGVDVGQMHHFPPPGEMHHMPPPGQMHHIPPPGPVQNVVIVNPPGPFGRDSQRMRCPYCQAEMYTRTESRATNQTHLVAILCCLFLCWLCAPFVYCCDTCMATDHYCSKCNRLIGSCTGN